MGYVNTVQETCQRLLSVYNPHKITDPMLMSAASQSLIALQQAGEAVAFSQVDARALGKKTDGSLSNEDKTLRDVPAPAAQNVVSKEIAVKPRARKKRKGRRPINLKEDRRIREAWQTGSYPDYAALAQARGIEKREVELAMDRERKRETQPVSEDPVKPE